jgi:ABC-type dipeptide/oligopeptide/nickel transport system permease component
MNRGRYVIRRLVQMVPVLFGITLIVFFMIQLIPGDPVLVMLGPRATQESVESLRQDLGLDKPIWQQYFYYVRNLVTLDLGQSLKFRVDVSELIQSRIQVTVFLVAYASLLTAFISLPLGILAALKKDSIFDQIVRVGLMVTMVMPAFWVGILFLMFFSVRLGLFPVSGYGEGALGHIRHLFLPALTIALSLSPILVRSLRASILESMGADYVKAARAKGLAERAVVFGHVLRNALIPTITLFGLSVGYLIGGTVIVEKVFSLPGAGALLVDSIGARDYPVVQSTTLIFAIFIIFVNLITDLTYTLLDPRVRLG